MRGIGGEIVPEVFEIDALATVDQLELRLAVEVEVPQVPEQPDRVQSPTPGRNASMSAIRSTSPGYWAA